jgi:hypothetical protein
MVDIDVEFQKLTQFLQGLDPSDIPLEEGLKKMIRFFDRLLVAFELSPDARKTELRLKLGDISQKIGMATKQLFEAAGLKDEELLVIAEKPEVFNEEQWRLVQEARGQITEYAKKISSLMVTTAPEQARIPQEGIKHEKKKPQQPPKKSWMKT